jgi:hypothetical protein
MHAIINQIPPEVRFFIIASILTILGLLIGNFPFWLKRRSRMRAKRKLAAEAASRKDDQGLTRLNEVLR